MEDCFLGILLENKLKTRTDMASKSLSLIVPAYRDEKTIVTQIKKLSSVLLEIVSDFEIILVVDGFNDKTFERSKKIKNLNLRVFGYKKNHGKGYAIKYGVKRAKKQIIGFIDSGTDLDPREISIMLDIMDWNNADIVVGSKLHPESKIKYPFWRKILSWGYRALTKILFGFNVKDTQVGLKIYRKKVAKDIFSKIIVKRFAFDVEVLAVASKLGYKKIYEAPVKINFKGANSITSSNFWRIVFWMLWDTAAVFYRLRIIHYYDNTNK